MSEILAIILDNENENENESCSGTYFDSSCDESDDTMDWEEVIESDEETDFEKIMQKTVTPHIQSHFDFSRPFELVFSII